MTKGRQKLLYCCSATFIMFLFLSNSALAAGKSEILNLSDKISNKKEKLDKLKDDIEIYAKKIDDARRRMTSLQNEIELLDNHIKKTELEIDEIETKIDQIGLEMLSLNIEINDAQKKIDLQKELVAYYLRDLQRLKSKNPLEIIFLNKSFSKFFNEIKQTEDLERGLGNAILELKKLQSDLSGRQDKLKSKKDENLKLKDDLENKRGKLGAQKTAKTILISQSFASENKFQALLFEAKKDEEDLDTEIKRMEGEIREKLKNNDLFPYGGNVVLTWPIPKNEITAFFHDPDYPYRYVFEHSGIDVRARQGTPVQAPAPGYVLKVRKSTTWRTYSYVVLVHAGGISTVYIHLSDVLVQPDTYVARGQIIGMTGGTPRTIGAGLFTTGPHLHFETRLNGIPANPLDYLVNL